MKGNCIKIKQHLYDQKILFVKQWTQSLPPQILQ